MKILSIKIKNLASLEGINEIDFTKEPLRSAGIFAITGPTGSGKSTLLDALCLALFAKTPRHENTNTIQIEDVGKHLINQNDVRGILSKGCAEGYAEVQFILAEAKERGFITAGSDAATYYLNGIKDQFAYDGSRLDVLNQGIAATDHNFAKSADIMPSAAYYAQPGVAYTGSTDQKLYKIRIQKWFALFYTGFEGWSEWRRTGVPKETKIGTASAIAAWPRRTRYPLGEQTVNITNYNAAIKVQGADNLLTRMWWDK